MFNTNNNWKTPFFIIFGGQAFSALSSHMTQFSLIWHLTDTTESPIVLSIASLAAFLPQALLGPFFGTIVDKGDRKLIMIASDVFIAAASLMLAAFFFFSDPAIWIIYAALALRSAGQAFHVPALQSSIPMLAPKEELTRIAGWQQFVYSAGNLAGPVLGISVAGMFAMEYVLLLDVLGAVIAGGCLLFTRIPNPEISAEDAARRGMFNEISYAVNILRGNKGIFYTSIAVTLIMLVFIPVGAVYPVMIKTRFMGTGYHAAVTEGMFGLGMIAGSLALSKWGAAKYHIALIAGSTAGIGLCTSAMGLMPAEGFLCFLALAVMGGSMAPILNGAYIAMLQTHIDPSLLGRVMSIVNSLMLIAAPAGLLIAGPLAEIISVPTWLAVSGVLMFVLGFGCFFIKIEEVKSIGNPEIVEENNLL